MREKLLKLQQKSLVQWLVIVAIGAFALASVTLAVSALRGLVIENCNDCQIVVQGGEEEVAGLLGSGSRFPNGISADSTSPSAGEVRGTDFTVTDDLSVTDDVSIGGVLTYTEAFEAVTATNTLLAAESGTTYYLSGDNYTTHTLPATSTPGQVFKFVINGAISASTTIRTASGVDSINGTLVVAGAVVDCDDEDTIAFVADGENIGDFVELRTDGTDWFIGASGGLTASKLICFTE